MPFSVKARSDGFSLIVGNIEALWKTKYVITLDTDTELPRDSARQLVGAMAHPLNLPLYDADKGRIVRGYGILQPRVAISLPGANRSRYARMWGAMPGIDPYTRVVSDVYQDLFGEGSFIGKGIYDVDAFERVLKGRFPENRILSHDLIEGCYLRSGLISDVQVAGRVPVAVQRGRQPPPPLDPGRLAASEMAVPRRSRPRRAIPEEPAHPVVALEDPRQPPAQPRVAGIDASCPAGWTALPSPLVLDCVDHRYRADSFPGHLPHGDTGRSPTSVLMGSISPARPRSAGRSVVQAIFVLLCLPHEAFFGVAAIPHTLMAMLVSGRGLLEWNTFGGGGPGEPDGTLPVPGSAMWMGRSLPARPRDISCMRGPCRPARCLADPEPLVDLSGHRLVDEHAPFSVRGDACRGPDVFLRKLSRKTWAFFEAFVDAADHWPPPDNYQEEPFLRLRTGSPTNMGLCPSSNLSACDFGYILRRKVHRPDGQSPCARWQPWRGIGATFTTGTTRSP